MREVSKKSRNGKIRIFNISGNFGGGSSVIVLMADFFIDILRQYPVLALFLTVGLGFLVGRIKIGSFSLGSVTSCLLIGVAVGQLNVPLSPQIQTVFFLLFLFSVGYSVGPDFFRSLRGSGLKQALFAVCMSCVCFGSVMLMAWLFSYSKGETVGLFSGSQTCSALLGVGAEAISRSGLGQESLQRELDIIPICYAVTYIFGTFGTIMILGNFGPKLLGGLNKVKAQTLELEKKLNSGNESDNPAYRNALRTIDYRSFRTADEYFRTPRTVHELEHYLRDKGLEVYVDRMRHDGEIWAPRHDDLISRGDDIVVCGRTEYMVDVERYVGPETADAELLSYPLDRVGVVVVKKQFMNCKLSQLRRRKYMHGVVIRDAYRDGQPLDINTETVFRKGDKLTVVGRPVQVKRATARIGHVERPTNQSDLMFVGLAIFIGGLFGAMSIWIGSIPVSFGTSGGALIAGLVFGWLRSKRPTYGHIPAGALWLMNNLGLNVFVSVVGINAAPSFVTGLKTIGPMLFVVGVIATMIPLFFGLFLGHKLFRFNPAITLGCCAGTRTCTAALGAVQNALGSTVPTIGYTVTYAVSNIMLVLWGLLAVMLI